jgi:hypothetical protein
MLPKMPEAGIEFGGFSIDRWKTSAYKQTSTAIRGRLFHR